MSDLILPLTRPLLSPLVVALTEARRGFGAPKPAIDYLLVVGSSTFDQVFALNPSLGRQENSARLAMTAAGLDLPIICRAVGGSVISELNNNINTYMSGLGPIGAKKVGVLINIGSNDIGVTAYSAATQAKKDAMALGLNSIIDKIEAFGFIPILGTSNSRKGYQSLFDEWAQLLYRPIIKARCPYWYVGALAVMDFCQFYGDNQAVPNWWHGDNVHPWMATPPLQSYIAAALAAKAAIPKVSGKERVLFYFPAGGQSAGGMNPITAVANGSSSSVFTTDGALLAGASFVWTNASGASGGVRQNPGVFDIGLAHTSVQGSSLVANGITSAFTFSAGAAYAGRAGKMRVTGNSSTAGRSTKITIGALSAVINISAPGVQVIELPFIADASGVITFTSAPVPSNNWSSVSGVEFEFDPA